MTTRKRSRSLPFFAAWLFALATAACGGGTSGKAFDTTHVHDVKPGQNKAGVLEWFGEPATKTTSTPDPKGCVETWIWQNGESSGGTTRGRALVVKFDPAGAVCDAAYAETNK